MTNRSKFDDIVENLSRRIAGHTSRRSFIGRVGTAVAGVALVPLLPVDRSGRVSRAQAGAGTRDGWNPQDKDIHQCDYWRHCSLDGYICGCAGGTLTSGGSVVIPHGFVVSEFWNWLDDYRCTWSAVVPTIISQLLDWKDPKANSRGAAFERIRFLRSSSAPLSPSLHREFIDRFKLVLIQAMGSSEAGNVFSNPLPPGENKIGSPVDQLLLYCYHYDPATGKYGAVVMNMIRLGGIATVMSMAALLLLLRRRGPAATSEQAGETANAEHG